MKNSTPEDNESTKSKKYVTLDRSDLITFALFAGSDLAGNGAHAVGGSKIIRFIYECKVDESISKTPLEIVSLWNDTRMNSSTLSAEASGKVLKSRDRLCSRCFHPGDCRQHLKFGCTKCLTKPNQKCTKVNAFDRFRKDMLKKISTTLSARKQVINAYVNAHKAVAIPLRTNRPELKLIFESSLLLSGRCKASSDSYALQIISKLLVRFALNNTSLDISNNDSKLMAKQILNRCIHKGHSCYKIRWEIPDFKYTFETFEWENIVNVTFPELVLSFGATERKVYQQTNQEKKG